MQRQKRTNTAHGARKGKVNTKDHKTENWFMWSSEGLAVVSEQTEDKIPDLTRFQFDSSCTGHVCSKV